MHRFLVEGLFLGEHMEKTVCQIVTYNSNLKIATNIEVAFMFHKGGHYQVCAV